METFDSLGVDKPFIEKLKERSIVKPTVIQNLVIPRLFEGKNILFRSATGTGKTFAYLLPALQPLAVDKAKAADNRYTTGKGPAVLICAPTLELCSQIKEEIDFFSELLAPVYRQTALLIGSVNLDRQIETLKKTKPAVAVGNPGRLLILAKTGKLKFNNLRFLVLDEADRLTAQECLEDTKELLEIIENETKKHGADNLRITACSATVSKKNCAQLGTLFASAEIIESDDHEILRERIEHWALFSEKRRKDQTLRSLLSALQNKPGKSKKTPIKALVFTSRNDEAALILSRLQYHHVSAAGLFGKVNKKPLTGADRKASLDSFKEGKVSVLVSTDLAARGLDIPGITHVIALDVPSDSEVYIHRCGRTGRAGKRGVMVTIGDETQMRLLASLEKKLKIRVMPKELHQGRVCVPEAD
jgi:superfamily II DNA/RNA helicase